MSEDRSKPLDLYFAPTPNGWKITIMLHECNIPYNLHLVNLGAGDQFAPEFLKISPNNRMPAIVDPHGPDGETLNLFESGAILTWLADRSQQFLAPSGAERYRALEWLYWQVGGLGPMAGQLSHFVNYAPKEGNEYSYNRYFDEYNRLLGVMERVLNEREFLAGAYSIADMAAFPWVVPYKRFQADLDSFPQVRRWFDTVKSRPKVQEGMNVGKDLVRSSPPDDKTRKMLFGQTAQSVKTAADKAQQRTSQSSAESDSDLILINEYTRNPASTCL